MGQESSQAAGDSQNSDGNMTQPEFRGREGEHLREDEGLKGNAVGQDLLIDDAVGAMKLQKTRKKRKKRKLSSFLQRTKEATEVPVVRRSRGESRGSGEGSQWPQNKEGTDDVSPVRPLKPANRKKAKLQSKKRLLFATATAAFGDSKSQYSDGKTAECTLDEAIDVMGSRKPELENNATANGMKTLNKSRKPEGATKVAAASKPKKSKSMATIAMKHEATNPDAENLSLPQQSKLDGTTKDSNREDAGRMIGHKKRKSSNLEGDSPIRPRKRKNRISEMTNANSVEAQTDDERSPFGVADLVNNLTEPGYHKSPPATLSIHLVSTSNGNTRALIPGDAYELDVDTPDLSPQSSRTKDVDLVTGHPKAAGYTRNGQVTGSNIKNSSNLSRKLRMTPVTGMMTPDKSQPLAVKKASIEPGQHYSVGLVPEDHEQQLGTYNDTPLPQTSGGRKRRLPVDDDILDTVVIKPIKEKTRKRGLRPKTPGVPKTSGTPKTNAPKVRANKMNVRNKSSDLNKRVTKRVSSSSKKDPTKILGKFSAAEIAILEREVLKHREMFNMSEYDQNQLIQDDATSASEFWKEVCEALPDRPRQAIIKMCRRKYHNYGIRGKWTEEEDKELREAYETFPNRWKEIGQYLHRHPEDVRDRWRNYGVCGDNQKKDSWTEEEEDNLRLAVAECLQAVEELKAAQAAKNPSLEYDTPDIELVDWLIVSEKLGHTRSRLQCLTKWKQIMKVENSDNEEIPDLNLENSSWRVSASKRAVRNMRRDDYLELLLAIRNSQAGREGTVPWWKIGDMDLKTKWSCMDRKVAWKKLRATVPGNEDMKLQDIVTELVGHLPAKYLIDAQFENKPPSRGPSRPAPQAIVQLSYRDRPSQVDHRFGPEEPQRKITTNEVYRYLGQGEEDEFDPDDFEEPHRDADNDFQSSQEVVQGVIEDEYDYENSESDERIMSDNNSRPSQQEWPSSDAAQRLSGPSFDFKQWGVETPVRRSARRSGSVDLDESW